MYQFGDRLRDRVNPGPGAAARMAAVNTRMLGALPAAPVGLGAMVLSPGIYGEVDDERGLTALRHALDEGATLIDTSDGYGADGHNERLVGTVVREWTKQGRRDEIVVATKFGFLVPDGAQPHTFPVAYSFGELAVNAEPRFVRQYAEASLRRLGTDHIDLYYPHFPDPAVPIEDTVGAVGELVDAGLVRHIGLSNVTPGQLEAAHAVRPIAAVQTQWSMWTPIDQELLATTRRLGTGIVAWGPLGTGFLTGTVTSVSGDDYRGNIPGFSAEHLAADHDRYAPVRAIAADAGITPAQLALAWLLHQGEHVVPIPGSRTPAHISENLASAAVTLTAAQVAALDTVLDGVSPSGTVRLM
jgi:aryl-alcohol dehydrogenase-like predicted oxidoreductase